MEHSKVRRATPADIPSILRILRESFRPGLLSVIPLGAPASDRYIEASLGPWGDTDWYVADDGEVCGFCEIRRLRDSICLNYICVDERHRGRGLGARLLKGTIQNYLKVGFETIILDVFSDAVTAMNWYKRLGFKLTIKAHWAELNMLAIAPAKSLPPGMNIHALGMAQATHKEFAISEFRIDVGQREFRIGRIGSDVYRCSDPLIVQDASALSVMRGIDVGRSKLILIAPAGNWKDSGKVKTLAEAERMQASLETVIANLR